MQWSAKLFQNFGGNRGAALQLLSGISGLIGVVYGLQVLMVERAHIPVCSAELLDSVGQQYFLKDQQLTVEVAGAVVQPGVWQLPVGSRIAEVINKAGGFSQRADRTFAAKGLNLADTIKDGQKIYVPFTGENTETETAKTSGSQSITSAGQTSINTASVKELETLPGIGEIRAADIIENRPYTSVDELLSKAVVTVSIFEEIKGLISL